MMPNLSQSMQEKAGILNPDMWDQLPPETRMSAITQVQEALITSALDSGLALSLLNERESLRAKNKGFRYAIMFAHKSDPIVSDSVRKQMGSSLYTIQQVDLKKKPPANGCEKFYKDFKIAKSAKPDGDLWGFICNGGLSFLVSIDLDAYLAKKQEQARLEEEERQEAIRLAEEAKRSEEDAKMDAMTKIESTGEIVGETTTSSQ